MSATEKRSVCVVCEGAEPHHSASPYCSPCGKKVARIRQAAIIAVRKAIRMGDLWHPKLRLCVDCGKQAHDYDHRDYSKPLQVDPVCRRCNLMRGPAITRMAA